MIHTWMWWALGVAMFCSFVIGCRVGSMFGHKERPRRWMGGYWEGDEKDPRRRDWL